MYVRCQRDSAILGSSLRREDHDSHDILRESSLPISFMSHCPSTFHDVCDYLSLYCINISAMIHRRISAITIAYITSSSREVQVSVFKFNSLGCISVSYHGKLGTAGVEIDNIKIYHRHISRIQYLHQRSYNFTA
jgi:hypothetical protein